MKKDAQASKISVVVPAYNAAATMERCLQSLKAQSDKNYEVIVVDDGSADGTAAISEKMGFRTVRLPANKGQAVARNRGVAQSSGEIIAFIDSDAAAPADWLARYRDLLRFMPDADMICSGYGESMGKGEAEVFAFLEIKYRRMNIPENRYSSTSSNCVIYRDAFLEVGGYPEYYLSRDPKARSKKSVSTNEDAELGFLLSERRKRIVWSYDNPVKHHFRKTWKGYFKQQVIFSRYVTLSFFKFPKMLHKSESVYSGEPILPQIIAISFMPIVPLALVLFYLFHRKFLAYLKKEMSDYRFSRIFSALLVSRFCWIFGMFLGTKDGMYMLWNRAFSRGDMV